MNNNNYKTSSQPSSSSSSSSAAAVLEPIHCCYPNRRHRNRFVETPPIQMKPTKGCHDRMNDAVYHLILYKNADFIGTLTSAPANNRRSRSKTSNNTDSTLIINIIILLDIIMCLKFIIYYIYLYLYRHRKSFRRKPSIQFNILHPTYPRSSHSFDSFDGSSGLT